MKILSENDLESIRNGDMAPLKDIFNSSYTFCVKKLKALYGCPESDAKDLTMDAIMVLRTKIMSSQYQNINLQSFLITVASNKWRTKQKRDKRLMEYYPNVLEKHLLIQGEKKESEYQRQRVNTIIKTIRSLGEPCQSVLYKNLVQGFSLDNVTESLGYKSKSALKVTKSRCMKKLKTKLYNQ